MGFIDDALQPGVIVDGDDASQFRDAVFYVRFFVASVDERFRAYAKTCAPYPAAYLREEYGVGTIWSEDGDDSVCVVVFELICFSGLGSVVFFVDSEGVAAKGRKADVAHSFEGIILGVGGVFGICYFNDSYGAEEFHPVEEEGEFYLFEPVDTGVFAVFGISGFIFGAQPVFISGINREQPQIRSLRDFGIFQA